MGINKIYTRKRIETIDDIQMDDSSKFNLLTFPDASHSKVSTLVDALGMVGEIWACGTDTDFVETVCGDLFYVMQIPGVYASIDMQDIKIPFFLFPLKNGSFIIHIYSEDDISVLSPYFDSGHFLVSKYGLQVSILEPVPLIIKDLVRGNYVA